MAHILIVEDDENLRMALEDNLVDEGYDVAVAADGLSALARLEQGGIDLVVLDIMLPDIDGYEVCRRLRAKQHPVSVLMLTARTLENDLVEGFDAGADDYLAKPYRLRELLARVGALLRRSATQAPVSQRLSFPGFRMDLAARVLSDEAGNEVVLTRTEYDLLACLLKNKGRAMSREDLLNEAWEPGIVIDPRTVDNFISHLKKKLGWTRGAGYRIKTVRGVGYRLEVD